MNPFQPEAQYLLPASSAASIAAASAFRLRLFAARTLAGGRT